MPEHRLNDHEERISSLEGGQHELKQQFEALNSTVLQHQSRADVRSEHMISQNESLIKQNERLSTQVENMFATVLSSLGEDSKRRQELKRLTAEGKTKIATMALGSGGIIFLMVDAIIRIVSR